MQFQGKIQFYDAIIGQSSFVTPLSLALLLWTSVPNLRNRRRHCLHTGLINQWQMGMEVVWFCSSRQQTEAERIYSVAIKNHQSGDDVTFLRMIETSSDRLGSLRWMYNIACGKCYCQTYDIIASIIVNQHDLNKHCLYAGYSLFILSYIRCQWRSVVQYLCDSWASHHHHHHRRHHQWIYSAPITTRP